MYFNKYIKYITMIIKIKNISVAPPNALFPYKTKALYTAVPRQHSSAFLWSQINFTF